MKQVPVHDLIQGKNLLFVDDSIVRGTQLRETVEFLYENELTQEAFSLLHIIIKASGVRLPEEYSCIVGNEKLRADFVEEAMADLEDILLDYE